MDVNHCAKLCESFFENQNKDIANEIANIPDENRIRCMRKKSDEEIYKTLSDFFADVTNDFKENYGDIQSIECSSNDNKQVADIIIHSDKDYNCELKFGAETNSNIGIESFENLFPFSFVMPSETRENWFNDVYVNHTKTEEEWLAYKKNYYNNAISNFNSQYQEKTLTDEQSNYLVNNIVNSSGSASKSCGNYVKYVLKRKHLVRKDPVKNEGSWQISSVSSISNPIKGRVNVNLTNGEYNVRFVLNWKNTFRKNGVEVPAKYGFGSPSYNVFVKKVKNEK